MTGFSHPTARFGRGSRAAGVASILAVGALTLSACGSSSGGDPLQKTSSASGGGSSSGIVVGSANFPESEIVAYIYAEALKAKGMTASVKPGIGAREVYIPALEDGSIGLVPDYTGNLLNYLNKDATATKPDAVEKALTKDLAKKDLIAYKPASATDQDAMVVTKQTAKKWNLTSIADLKAHEKDIKLGAPTEFQQRPQGLPGLKKNYGLEPGSFKGLNDGGGAPTVNALKSGAINVADIFTTSPAIKANGFVVLKDPKNNFPAGNVVPILRKDKGSDKIEKTLDAVSAKLTTDQLVDLNDEVSGKKKTEPNAAAKQWVKDQRLDSK